MNIRSKLNLCLKGVLAVAAALSLPFALDAPAHTATLATIGTYFPLYVADNLSNSIIKVDAAGGRTVLTSGGNLNLWAYQPVGLALDISGTLYVGSLGNHSIIKVNANGAQSVFTSGGYLNTPDALAFDGNGTLYVASLNNASIVKVDSTGAQTLFTSGNYLDGPTALAFDGNGDLYVANWANSNIVKVDSAGVQSLFTSGGNISGATGLVFDSAGNLLVTSEFTHSIVKVDSQGAQSIFASGNYLSHHLGMAFDGSGILYVTSISYGAVVKIDSAGTQSLFTPFLGMSGPGGLAFSQAPNTAPKIKAGPAVTRQQGSPAGSAVTIASVSDAETPKGSLVVTAVNVPNGIILGPITNNKGMISATVAADYTAALGDNNILLSVSDGRLSATAPFTVRVTANTPPDIKAGAAVTRQKGSPAGAAVTIATVSDSGTPKGSLIVTALSVPNGIILGPITNTNGTVTSTVAADYTAALGDNNILLSVNDGWDSATAFFTVRVTANTPPTLGNYPSAVTVNLGAGTTITPQAPPTDNGSVTSLTAVAPGFTGSLSANLATGVITVSNAGPEGKYTVLVTATDNCGAMTSAFLTVTVKK